MYKRDEFINYNLSILRTSIQFIVSLIPPFLGGYFSSAKREKILKQE